MIRYLMTITLADNRAHPLSHDFFCTRDNMLMSWSFSRTNQLLAHTLSHSIDLNCRKLEEESDHKSPGKAADWNTRSDFEPLRACFPSLTRFADCDVCVRER